MLEKIGPGGRVPARMGGGGLRGTLVDATRTIGLRRATGAAVSAWNFKEVDRSPDCEGYGESVDEIRGCCGGTRGEGDVR